MAPLQQEVTDCPSRKTVLSVHTHYSAVNCLMAHKGAAVRSPQKI